MSDYCNDRNDRNDRDSKQLKAEAVKDIIGKTFEEAERIFLEKYPQFSIRYNRKDGQTVQGHKNIDHNRLNIAIQDGVVLGKYNYEEGGVKYYDLPEWH